MFIQHIWKSRQRRNRIILWVSIFLVFVGWLYYRDSQKEKALMKSKYNFAVVSDKYHASRLGNYIEVYHFINGKIIDSERFDPKHCYGQVNIGDTVLIKYAIDKPEIVELESCYWNREKYEKLIGRVPD